MPQALNQRGFLLQGVHGRQGALRCRRTVAPCCPNVRPLEGRRTDAPVSVMAFPSKAGAQALAATIRAIGLASRFAAWVRDARARERARHDKAILVGQHLQASAPGHPLENAFALPRATIQMSPSEEAG